MENITLDCSVKSNNSVIIWTFLKFPLLLGINILVFLPIPTYILWILFGVEIALGVVVKLKIDNIIPILKFLLINLIPIFVLFYFVDYDWVNAFLYFGEFSVKIFVLLFSILLFAHTTPVRVLMVSFSKIGFPKRFSLVLIIGINFIPLISTQLRAVVKLQKSRGYRFNLFKLKPILVPVILNLLDLSTNLSLSLESRGLDF